MPESAAGPTPGRSGLRPERPPETALSAIVDGLDRDTDVVVTGITLDSRLVQPGDLYVALSGARRHGADFAVDAVRRGAVAVLTDATGAERLSLPGRDVAVPVIVRADVRHRLGRLAASVYGDPSRQLIVFGITGTNGKTTTSHLLAAALRHAGLRTGVIGTLGFFVDDELLTGPRTTITTPEAPDLHAVLAVMVEGRAEAVVMEVSSHALALGRVDGVDFDVVAFTNFGRDHLDFHGTVENYFEAKARLFTPERARRAVLSLDDPRGRELVSRLRSAPPGPPPTPPRTAPRTAPPNPLPTRLAVATVSLDDDRADYRMVAASAEEDGSSWVIVRTPDREVAFGLGLPGDFNIRNALTALAMAEQAGVDPALAAPGLAAATVPGRMQPVRLDPPGPAVVIDFAHTPQAVTSVLRALAGRRRITVLGCGGDRDPEKRAPMGAAAAADSDVVVVTDDNPRSENPAMIRAEVLRGAREEQVRQRDERGRAVEVVDGGDRRSAISLALGHAREGDVVAVLGKGHEAGQEIAGRILPFDDHDVVRSVWAELRSTATESVR